MNLTIAKFQHNRSEVLFRFMREIVVVAPAMFKVCFAPAALLIALPLFGHDLYLKPSTFRPQPGQVLRIQYHNGDSFPASEAPVKPERLKDAQLQTAGGTQPFSNIHAAGRMTVAEVAAPAQRGSFLLVSRTVPNFIELPAPKFETYLKHEGLDHVIAWRAKNGQSRKSGREQYSKYVKSLGYVGEPSGFDKRAGLAIEFVPVDDPYALKGAGTLPVRVLVRGEPQAGLMVEASNAYRGKVSKRAIGRTDAKGEIRVPVSGPGLWKLHTIHMERREDSKHFDWESLWASLTFELESPRPVNVTTRRGR